MDDNVKKLIDKLVETVEAHTKSSPPKELMPMHYMMLAKAELIITDYRNGKIPEKDIKGILRSAIKAFGDYQEMASNFDQTLVVKFAMNPENWAEMVEQVRILERALGSNEKFVTGSEQETYILQRRCLRAARDIKAGETLDAVMVEPLRPAAEGAIMPWELETLIGKKALIDMPFGMDLRWENIGA